MLLRAKNLKKRLFFLKFSRKGKWILGVCCVALFMVMQFLFIQQLMAYRLASYGYGYQYGYYGYGYQLSSAIPKAPGGLTVIEATDSSISLSWNAVTEAQDNTLISEGGGNIIYYTIYRSSSPNGSYEARASVNTTSWTETDLPQETTFYYKVTATDDNYNESAKSSYVSGTTLDVISPGDITNFSAVAGDEQISLTWTNPSDSDFAGTRVLRKIGSYPANPTDGTVVYDGTGTSHIDTSLTNGITYYYTAFAYDEVPNYSSTVASAQDLATPQDVTSPGDVTNFDAVAGDRQISLIWTNPPDPDFAGTKVLRKTGSYPTSPTDGSVVYDSTGTSFTDTGLTNGVTYYYTAFVYDEVPNYSSAVASAQDSATPQDVTSPGNVTNFSAIPSDRQISLSWTNPSDSDFAGTKILRKTTSYPTSPTDGTVAYNGTGTSYTDTGLTNGTIYYYTAFAYDEVPNYSSGVNVSAIPSDITSPSQITSLSAKPGDKYINLSWKNPVDPDFKGVRIIRRKSRYPQNATDGILVYNGKGTSHKDTGLTNGIRYYYSLFTYDGMFNYSSPAKVSAVPTKPKVVKDSTPTGSLKNFSATPGDSHIKLSWRNPTDADFQGVRILRRTDRYPKHVTDGTLIYKGKGTSWKDSGLTNERRYYYTAFAYDEVPNYSFPVYASTILKLPTGRLALITGAGLGGGPHVRGFDKDGNALSLSFLAYHSDFKGGVRVATGDVDGDGIDDIIVGAGSGGGPHVRVFEKNGSWTGWDMFPFHPDFRGGVDVATGDADGDGIDEIAVSQFSQGQCWVKVYKYDAPHTILGEWNAFGPFEGGGTVAMGDVDGDGKDEVIVGAGPGGGPHVKVFEANGKYIGDFWPFHPTFSGGVDVAAGDVDLDGKDEIVMSQRSSGEAWIKVYRYDIARTILGEWRAYPQGVECGANVDMFDIDSDAKAEVLTGAGMSGGPHVRAFEADGAAKPLSFFAYNPAFRGGVTVAGGEF